MKFAVIVSNLNLRSGAGTQHPVIGSLSLGTQVTLVDPRAELGRWAEINVGGQTGFVARRMLRQLDSFPDVSVSDAAEEAVSALISKLTIQYDAVNYRLGCKARRQGAGLVFSGKDISGAPCSGSTVDCSGWVYGIADVLLAQLAPSNRPALLTGQLLRRLSNHSDAQMVAASRAAGSLWSGTSVDAVATHGGVLIGLNNGDYDWEGRERTLGVDHIVITFKKNNTLFISQSSSSGGGVNSVPWQTWRTANNSLFQSGRVHAVSLFADKAGAAPSGLVPFMAGPLSTTAEGLDEPDPFAAPPG